jgi:HlyD family secretion protein
MRLRTEWRLAAPVIAAGVVALGGGAWWLTHRGPAVSYVTAPVTRGDVTTAITASGTVNPVVTVQVGTYVSGTIISLSCDFNTRVHKGQLCAKIDPAPYQIIVDEDQADLATARAQLAKDQANAVYTKLASDRAALLFKEDSGSRDAADAALDAHEQAVALVRLDVAQVAQKAALLKAARINLNYTNIVSPVDGTVVTRDITAGQTVAASLQTPTLFLIARDLTKMQVDTNVSESDIAGAVEGAGASFTVDAFPSRIFKGVVAQVRQSPISVQNVITYDAVIAVDNPGLSLKPGMTATASIIKSQSRGVLRVPSQGLRFMPPGAARLPAGQRAVWVRRDGKLVRVPVTVGLDDQSFAEIKSGDLKPGDQVVTSEVAAGQTGRPQAAAPPALHV